MAKYYDVCIIGSGPAGLFAADKLSENGLKVGIIEKTSYCSGGLMNDGKLNLTTRIGMDLEKLELHVDKAEEYIRYIDDKLVGFGADSKVYGTDEEKVNEWISRAKEYGLELISARQRHIGTDKAKFLIKSFREYLVGKGVEFNLNTKIDSIRSVITDDSNFRLTSKDVEFKSKYLIVSPGRTGAYWFRKQAEQLGVKTKFGPIDIGIRLEMPNEYYDEITDIIYDPKFRYKTLTHGDIVRTFCTNKGGRIRVEKFDSDGKKLRLINGDANKKKKTENTNMAILVTVTLTYPVTDTTMYGRDAVTSTLNIGGGLPIVQRMGDFMNGRRSKLETFNEVPYNKLTPTLSVPKSAQPGDITRAYFANVVDNIREFFGVMGKLFRGYTSPENLIYAPEVKFYDTDYITSVDLETTVSNLFVAGDGCGKSRGIIGAAMTGIMAAEGILNK